MLVVAGAISFNKEKFVSNDIKKELNDSLFRNNAEQISHLENESFYITIASMHHGAFQQQCYDDNDSLTLLLGNPYLENLRDGSKNSLKNQLNEIHNICNKHNWDTLKTNCRGAFAVVHYSKKENKLIFISDKLGVRPLYYCSDGTRLFFSSALRILESCSFVPLGLDIRGVSEIVAFGFPLATRTPYQGIKRIAAAEILQFKLNNEISKKYWRWDALPEVKAESTSSLAKDSFFHFSNAVKIRLSGDSVVNSFLSGGLDSRCIAMLLKEFDCRIHACNFSPPNSQDRYFASQFAEKAELLYKECNFVKGANWSQMMADALSEQSCETSSMPDRPWVVWSGDGGSVGAGCVYLNHEIVDAALQGEMDKAINLYTTYNKINLPFKILNRSLREELQNVVASGIHEEMARFRHANPARALHLFLMENDQRRHLDRHFENLDLHKLEFMLPFFDSFFLERVFSLPVKCSLEHEFYMDWFKLFPSLAQEIPWQTYPGHKKCPLSSKQNLQYQWDQDARKNREKHDESKEIVKSFLKKYRTKSFPKQILKGNVLLTACFLQYFKIKNYDYLFSAADKYITYFKKSQRV